jgi:hypothetical protein
MREERNDRSNVIRDWPAGVGPSDRKLGLRVLLTTQPAYGHFFPMLPLAVALQSAGHDFAFATSATFCLVVHQHGFPAFPVGLDWTESDWSTLPADEVPPPEATTEEFFATVFVHLTGSRMLPDLLALARHWCPDLIVRGTTEFSAALVAETLGLPHAAVQVAAPSAYSPELLRQAAAPYNALRRQIGLAHDPDLRTLRTETVLAFAPPGLNDPEVPPISSNVVWLRTDAAAEMPAGTAPAWIQALGRGGRRVVYATLGTVFNQVPVPFFRCVLDGLHDEAVDVVVTVGPNGDPDAFGPLPPNARVERYVPQALLLGRCDVVVFHGGFGTLLGALQSGVPVVLVPFGADQPDNARSCEARGFGRVLPPESLSPEAMRGAVLGVLNDPAYRLAARSMRDEMRALPGPLEAVALLEGLVAYPV